MDIFKLLGLLIDFLESTMPRWVRLDSGELVGELTPAIDYQPSNRWTHAQRGGTHDRRSFLQWSSIILSSQEEGEDH